MATQYAFGQIVTSGLVLTLDAADRNSYPGSGTTWTDMSGNGNNGTLTNGPTFSSANGGSIVFDGVDDFMNLGDSNSWFYSTNNFSIEFWYKFNSIPNSSGQYFYSQRVDGANYFFIFATNTTWTFDSFSNSIQGPTIIYSTTHNTTSWNCLTLSRVDNTFTLYLNSNLVGTQVNSSTLLNLSAPLEFGRWSGGPGLYINASIPVVRIYNNKGLSASEIKQNYDAQKSRFGL